MSTLAQLQQRLQQHVLTGDLAVLSEIDDSERIPARTRLGVYAEAYRLRLIEALASNMPRLQQLLGEQAFAALAQQYIEHHPSTFTSIRWFGEHLAAMLAQLHPQQPWLAELAAWEWAIAAAFDAPDIEPLGFASLAGFVPEDWPLLAFDFHPSVQCLQVGSNAPVLFKALTEEQLPPQPAMLAAPQSWLIWRHELKTQFRSMDEPEAATLALTQEGGTFAAMCQTLCNWYEAQEVPARAATLLKQWLAAGSITGVRCTRA